MKNLYVQLSDEQYCVKIDRYAQLFHIEALKKLSSEAVNTSRQLCKIVMEERENLLLKGDQASTKCYHFQANVINIGSHFYETTGLKGHRQKWEQYGLNTNQHLESERLFLLSLFDLHLISWQRVDQQLKQIGEEYSTSRDDAGCVSHNDAVLLKRTLQKLENVGSRALYALQLDAGAVLVAVSGVGDVAVRQVWTLFDLPVTFNEHQISEGFVQYEKSITCQQEQSSILIGADPEFIVINEDNKIVSATKYFDGYLQEQIGADAIRYKGKVIYPLVEIRPLPQPHPVMLLRHIKRLLHDANDYIQDHNIKWLAGAMPYPGIALGGHIHFSGVVVTPRLLHLLDHCAAIVIACLEDPNGRGRYRFYGALGDYRRQPYGGFEYRTLPSWLISPALAKFALTLAYACVAGYDQLSSVAVYRDEWLEAYMNHDEVAMRIASHEIFCWLHQLEIEGINKKDIEVIFDAIAHHKRWNEEVDIRTRWGIVSKTNK